ncbi:MAG: arginase, partial [Flavobacterium sp.]
MGLDFLEPLNADFLEFIDGLPAQSLGRKVVLHTEEVFPEMEKGTIAIIGVLENRGADDDRKDHVHLNYIRKQFYSLYPGNWDMPLVDLGNIPAGDSAQDSHFALKSSVAYLIKNKIIPIVLGGSQDLTYAVYRAYDGLEQMVNLVAIDSKFDFGKEEEELSARSYLTKIIIDEPNNLFNYSNIGYQTYYNSQEEIDLIDKLFFDAYRLGEVSNSPSIAEPVFRDADMVSIDMSAVKSSASGNFVNFIPNG